MNAGKTVNPSNPVSSRSRAVVSLHAANTYFPDGERDKIRLLDNERAIGDDLERDFPVLRESTRPVLARPWTAREVVTGQWIRNDKNIDKENPPVKTFAMSISCSSINGSIDRIRDLGLPALPRVFGGSRDCNRAYSLCLPRENTWVSSTPLVDKIPACIRNARNMESLNLQGTNVNKIENLEQNWKLETIDLHDTEITKIEGLDKNRRLKYLDASYTHIKKIENLGKLVDLNTLDLRGTPVEKIENIQYLYNLKEIQLTNTDVKKMENLPAGLDQLTLKKTKIKKIENLDALHELRLLDISDTGVKKLENLGNNTSLSYLNASNTRINKIENLEQNVNLTNLDLSRTGVQKIEGLDNNIKLESIRLHNTPIRKIENLDKLKNLLFLYLQNTLVKETDVESFRKANPRVLVTF